MSVHARARLVIASLAVGLFGCDASGPSGPASERPQAGGKADDVDAEGEEQRAAFVREELQAWNGELAAADREAKFEKMSAGPFPFYRGTNHLFWADFAGDPRLDRFGGPLTWIQGDLHAQNFGAFANDDGEIIYALNDFDEGVIADYQYDVWRMAVSVVLVARDNGLDDDAARGAIEAFVSSYLERLQAFDGNADEQDFRIDADVAFGRLDEFLEEVEAEESRERMLGAWTLDTDAGRRFDLENPKLERIEPELRDTLLAAIAAYPATLRSGLRDDERYFAVKDVAWRRLAGIGSLGTPRFYALLEGPSEAEDDDIILDIKRQGEPTAFSFVPETRTRTASTTHAAHRVAEAYRALETNIDDHIGWLELGGEPYSVRQRDPYKETLPTDELDSPTRLEKLAQQWGAILAASHARADADAGWGEASLEADVVDAIGPDADEFVDVNVDLALSYAAQVERDYQTFMTSVR